MVRNLGKKLVLYWGGKNKLTLSTVALIESRYWCKLIQVNIISWTNHSRWKNHIIFLLARLSHLMNLQMYTFTPLNSTKSLYIFLKWCHSNVQMHSILVNHRKFNSKNYLSKESWCYFCSLAQWNSLACCQGVNLCPRRVAISVHIMDWGNIENWLVYTFFRKRINCANMAQRKQRLSLHFLHPVYRPYLRHGIQQCKSYLIWKPFWSTTLRLCCSWTMVQSYVTDA